MESPTKVMVVDDDEALLQTLGWIFKDKGYEVVAVSDGATLLSKIEMERPDLILLDINIPNADGLELLERIKAQEEWRDVPVVMLSSMQPEEATVDAFAKGAADYIAKPFRVRELLARVAAHLKQSSEMRRIREESKGRSEMVDIMYEVTESLKPDEIYHILTRRVARALRLSKCSMVSSQPGSDIGLVVAAAENPMLRNLEIPLNKYPEVRKALETGETVLVTDVATDPLYEEMRLEWQSDGMRVTTRSTVVLPFSLHGKQAGVLFLRTTDDDQPLTAGDASFAEGVIKAAVNAIERAHDLETARSDSERFQEMANTDPLTGCMNRRAMLDQLEKELGRSRRYRHPLTVLMIDLDWFKEINDTRGHLVGDRVLRELGEILLEEARKMDIVARYGGEEFTIALPDTGIEGGIIFAERLREHAEQHDYREEDGDSIHVTVSVGVATYEEGTVTAEELIAAADAALYRAKEAGRNQVHQ